MAAPFNDLLSKVEAAYKSVIDALALTGKRGSEDGVAVTVLTGLDDETAELPKVICAAQDTAEEVHYNTGILRLTVQIHVISHSADESLAIHRARLAAVADAVMTDDRAAVLSAAVDDFHCYDVHWLGLSADPDGNSFHTIAELSAVCCGADV